MAKFEFDAIVVGGGAAGLTASGIAANFGAKTLMIESARLGGDCTWTGCVPSKVLLKAGKVAQQLRSAGKYGLIEEDPSINFKKIISHVRQVRQEIYEEADKPEIFEGMGIEVVFGKAAFEDPHSLSIALNNGEERTVTGRYIFVATGASAFVPGIPGLKELPYLTNESLFEIDNLPEELIIIGGGPVGTEMSQAFVNLGSKVTVIDQADHIMSNDDPELVEILMKRLISEGVRYELGASVERTEQDEERIRVHLLQNGKKKRIEGTHLLIATGRSPNVNGLNLEAAGVRYSAKGIQVDDSCRTNVRHIYAIGDVSGQYQFTHMSEHMAKVAMTKALLKFPMKIDRNNVAWTTYTQPELGHVGRTENQLRTEGKSYEVYRFPYSKIDRALTEGEPEGLIKIFATKLGGKIYGAAVAGAHAGEIISEYALAIRNGVSMRNIADTIHPYPSWGLGARRAADQWYIRNQSEWAVKLVKAVFGYRGEVPDFSDPDRII